MDKRLFIHVNWGPVLTRLHCHKDEWYINVIVDGNPACQITKSNFFRIPKGHHTITLLLNCERKGQAAYVNAWGTNIVVGDSDVHLTVNIYFFNDNKVEFLEGNVECNLEKSKPDGCYIATAIYESYDCPPVWTLRRFRDESLGATWHGRTFIRIYYVISPTLVRWFGDRTWFKKLCKRPLDALVRKLEKKGIANTPYKDKEWRKHK